MPTRADACACLAAGAPAYPTALARRLGEHAPAQLTACGDAALLRQPLLGFFCSVRVPGSVILGALDAARTLRDLGVAVVGGFQSPLERECLELLLRGRQPVVVCPARGIEGMRLPAAWRRPLEEGRLLVLSGFPTRLRRPTRPVADARNRLVLALAQRVLLAHAAPGGRTFALARLALEWGLPTYALDDRHNTDLLLLGARALGTTREALRRLAPAGGAA